MMFTTTIRVSSIYSTNSVVMVPIIWLYITVVVIVVSFSIIVSEGIRKTASERTLNLFLGVLDLSASSG
jgi:hypothetical protein